MSSIILNQEYVSYNGINVLNKILTESSNPCNNEDLRKVYAKICIEGFIEVASTLSTDKDVDFQKFVEQLDISFGSKLDELTSLT